MNFRGIIGGLYMKEFTTNKDELSKCINNLQQSAKYIEDLVNHAKVEGYNKGYMDAKERYEG